MDVKFKEPRTFSLKAWLSPEAVKKVEWQIPAQKWLRQGPTVRRCTGSSRSTAVYTLGELLYVNQWEKTLPFEASLILHLIPQNL